MNVEYSVIVPAYNEEETIEQAIRETSKIFARLSSRFELLIVDDGSHDRTAKIVLQLQKNLPMLRLLRHETNLGKGAAIQMGVTQASGEILLFLDSDLATHPREFLSFLPYLKTYDLIIGSRRANGTRILQSQPWYRVWFGQFFNFLAVRLYLGLPFRDTQCGFKALRKSLKPIFSSMKSCGWVFDIELIHRAQQEGFRIKELPVTWQDGLRSRVKIRHVFTIIKELRKIKRHQRITEIESRRTPE